MDKYYVSSSDSLAEALQGLMSMFEKVLDDPTHADDFHAYREAKAALKKAGVEKCLKT